jgi:MFS family permease
VVPLHRRPTFMGSIGGMWGIASVAGPLLGGVFTVCFFSLLWKAGADGKCQTGQSDLATLLLH